MVILVLGVSLAVWGGGRSVGGLLRDAVGDLHVRIGCHSTGWWPGRNRKEKSQFLSLGVRCSFNDWDPLNSMLLAGEYGRGLELSGFESGLRAVPLASSALGPFPLDPSHASGTLESKLLDGL